MGSTPVASGSSVPAWPAFLAANARLTTDTAWVEVMPTGLSSTTQPSTLRFSRLRWADGIGCSGVLTSNTYASQVRLAIDNRALAAQTEANSPLLAADKAFDDPAANRLGTITQRFRCRRTQETIGAQVAACMISSHAVGNDIDEPCRDVCRIDLPASRGHGSQLPYQLVIVPGVPVVLVQRGYDEGRSHGDA